MVRINRQAFHYRARKEERGISSNQMRLDRRQSKKYPKATMEGEVPHGAHLEKVSAYIVAFRRDLFLLAFVPRRSWLEGHA